MTRRMKIKAGVTGECGAICATDWRAVFDRRNACFESSARCSSLCRQRVPGGLCGFQKIGRIKRKIAFYTANLPVFQTGDAGRQRTSRNGLHAALPAIRLPTALGWPTRFSSKSSPVKRLIQSSDNSVRRGVVGGPIACLIRLPRSSSPRHRSAFGSNARMHRSRLPGNH